MIAQEARDIIDVLAGDRDCERIGKNCPTLRQLVCRTQQCNGFRGQTRGVVHNQLLKGYRLKQMSKERICKCKSFPPSLAGPNRVTVTCSGDFWLGASGTRFGPTLNSSQLDDRQTSAAI